ncbi:sensor histidine kinase [Cohnella phaseoli]|uniref:Two-component system sensor histidine kinase YesM n=1 Tax=Cohnella phaseoli TaxID=456490 RepID=A0A3D9JT64_9BACL|nr:sensor histidine kinase [Cohnella phaseoli]RED76727.1 two-component system sensor histidine kinase YesM [Cohnella phaseoli]
MEKRTMPRDKQPRWGIYKKLVGSFLLILIPIYVISLWMNQQGADVVRQEIAKSMQQKTDYVMTSLENEIERITTLQQTFINDADLNDLSIRAATLTDYERTKAFKDLQAKIVMLAESSKLIQDVFVLMPKLDKRLSAKSRFNVDTMDRGEYESLLKAKNRLFNPVYYKGRLLLPLGYPSATRSQYLLVIELSSEKIGREMDVFRSYEDNVTYLTDDYNQATLYAYADGVEAADRIQSLEQDGRGELTIDGMPYLVFSKRSDMLQWSLRTALPENIVLDPVYSIKRWYGYLSAVSIVIVLIASLMIFRLIHQPLKKLVTGFRKVEQGKLDIVIERREHDEFAYLYTQFNRMVAKLNELIQEVYEKTIYSQKSELKQLQSQINPHFLYNSLYILYLMADEEDYDGIRILSRHLGDYFKFLTHNKADIIPLEQELNHARVYGAIQEIRFSNRISCEYTVEGDPSEWQVPRLIVQPVLENAFIHGHEHTEENGRISVRVRCEHEALTITVEDNGNGIDEEKLAEVRKKLTLRHDETETHGIVNVHRRLGLLYGSASGVRIDPVAGGGTAVTLRIEARPVDRGEEGEWQLASYSGRR